jgi:hypothetical protein
MRARERPCQISTNRNIIMVPFIAYVRSDTIILVVEHALAAYCIIAGRAPCREGKARITSLSGSVLPASFHA